MKAHRLRPGKCRAEGWTNSDDPRLAAFTEVEIDCPLHFERLHVRPECLRGDPVGQMATGGCRWRKAGKHVSGCRFEHRLILIGTADAKAAAPNGIGNMPGIAVWRSGMHEKRGSMDIEWQLIRTIGDNRKRTPQDHGNPERIGCSRPSRSTLFQEVEHHETGARNFEPKGLCDRGAALPWHGVHSERA